MNFYRYEAVQYVSMSDEGDYSESLLSKFPNPILELRVFNLFKETPKGYWIGHGHPNIGLHDKGKWVSKTSKKRFAYPTRKEALLNYIKRTEKAIKIMKNRIDFSKSALLKAEKLYKLENEI